jgi:hypothetical protein
MEKCIFDFSAKELVALAGSLAIAMSEKFDDETICSIKLFLSTLQSNLNLIEFHDKGCRKRRGIIK